MPLGQRIGLAVTDLANDLLAADPTGQGFQERTAVREGAGDAGPGGHLLGAEREAAVAARAAVGGVVVQEVLRTVKVVTSRLDGAEGGEEILGSGPLVATGGVSAARAGTGGTPLFSEAPICCRGAAAGVPRRDGRP